MIDYRLHLMLGIEIPIPELQLTLHVPTIKDIGYMGEKDFFTAMQYLCLQKEQLVQDESILSSTTNFQVLMKVLEQSNDKDKKTAIRTLLSVLFPDYQVVMSPRSIIITKDNHPVMIDDSNFDFFQDVIRQVLCVNSLFQNENIVYNPVGEQAQRIADKLMKSRMKIAAMKSSKNNSSSVITRYISILVVAEIIDIDKCANLNLFQLFDLMERYTAYVEWDTDLKVRLAGGKPDKQIESWMKDLHPAN